MGQADNTGQCNNSRRSDDTMFMEMILPDGIVENSTGGHHGKICLLYSYSKIQGVSILN